MGIACFFLICSIVHALGTLIEQRKPHHAYASLGSCRGCSVTSRGATQSSSPQLPLVWVKKQFIQRQLSTPMFNCSASIPPLLLPLASSFLTLFILASAYGILTGVRRCFEDFDNISLSINLNHSKTISICFKHFELSLSRRGLRQPPLSLFPSSASIFSQLPLAS